MCTNPKIGSGKHNAWLLFIYLFILHYTRFACIYGNASIITINNLLKLKKKLSLLHELRIIVSKIAQLYCVCSNVSPL